MGSFYFQILILSCHLLYAGLTVLQCYLLEVNTSGQLLQVVLRIELLARGIILLDIQFLLQYTLGLRAMGVTQAVLVNLRKKHSRYHGNIKPRQSERLAGLCVFSVCE